MISLLVMSRRKRRLSQKQVARNFGACRQWVSKIEHCEIEIGIITLIRLCRMYGIRSSDVVRRLEKAVRTGRLFFAIAKSLMSEIRAKSGFLKIQTCSHFKFRLAQSLVYPMVAKRRIIFHPKPPVLYKSLSDRVFKNLAPTERLDTVLQICAGVIQW